MQERVVIYGTGVCGKEAYMCLRSVYNVVAWADRNPDKVGLFYYSLPVLSVEELINKYRATDMGIIVSLNDYYEVSKYLADAGVYVMGYFSMAAKRVYPWQAITWEEIRQKKTINLYAGDIVDDRLGYYPDRICLSINRKNFFTVLHDITWKYPLNDNTVDSYQSEDVAEHIEETKQINVINEIYRVLKPGAIFRWSLPDYGCPALLERSFVDKNGNPIFDPNGGGSYIDGKVLNGGHVWFPTYERVVEILENSYFRKYKFYRYFSKENGWYTDDIDFSKGYISRVKENDARQIDMSIVVDCQK